MTCPHCNSQIPDGLIVCFRCGKLLIPSEVPQHSAPPLQSIQSVQPQPVQHEQPAPSPSDQTPSDQSQSNQSQKEQETARSSATGTVTGTRSGIRAVFAIAVILILLSGGAAGGHMIGLYTLPFLPERPSAGTAADSPTVVTDDESGQEGIIIENSGTVTDNIDSGTAFFETQFPGGYSVSIHRTGERSGTFTLTDPEIQTSYPATSDEMSESAMLYLWRISFLAYDLHLDLVHFNFQFGESDYITPEKMQSSVFKGGRMVINPVPVTVSGQTITWDLEIPEDIDFAWSGITEYRVEIARAEEGFWFSETFEADVSSYKAEQNEGTDQNLEDQPVQMKPRYVMPGLTVSVDEQNPSHGTVTLSGYPVPDWIFPEQDPAEEGSNGHLWAVYLSTDGENLYSIYSSHWQGRSTGDYVGTDYGIPADLTHFNEDYSSHVSTPATCYVTHVTEDSVTWELTLTGEESLDLNNLNYIGYEISSNDGFIDTWYSYILLDGAWMDMKDMPLPEYLNNIYAPQVWFEGIMNGDGGEEMLRIESTEVTRLDNGDLQCHVVFANIMDWAVHVDILMDISYGNYDSASVNDILAVEDAILTRNSSLEHTFTIDGDDAGGICQVWFYYYHY